MDNRTPSVQPSYGRARPFGAAVIRSIAQSCQGRALLLPTAMTWQISPLLRCGHRASPPQPYHGLSPCCQLRFSHAAMAWSIVPLGELCHGRSCSFHAAIPGSKLPLSCRRRTHTAMLRLTKLLLLGSTRLLRCSHAMVDHVSPLPFCQGQSHPSVQPRYGHARLGGSAVIRSIGHPLRSYAMAELFSSLQLDMANIIANVQPRCGHRASPTQPYYGLSRHC